MKKHTEPKPKIMIVEDETIVAAALESILKNLGYEICGAMNTAEKALESIEKEQPDLVSMDIVMKGRMDGIEAAEIIRSRWQIPVIFVTAYADEKRLQRVKPTLPFGYILKPFTERDIKVAFEMALYVAKIRAERKQAEEALGQSEKRLREAQKIGQMGSFEWNIPKNESICSEEFSRIFGLEAGHPRNLESFIKSLHPEDRDRIAKETEEAVQEKKSYKYEYRVVRPDRAERTVLSKGRVKCDKNGKPLRLVGMVQDITEQKQAKEALRLAKEKAETANRVKSDFLASMSHELRTPLNAVIGFSDVLKKQYFGELNKKQAEYVEYINDSGKRLLALVNDILDLSKMEAGKMKLQRCQVNLEDLLQNSLLMIKEECDVRNMTIEINIAEALIGLEIQTDERMLKQTMFNLLSNAAKFTPDGGEIRVSARIVDCRLAIDDLKKSEGSTEKQSTIEVSVADTGIGIPPEDQEKIFHEFHQIKCGLSDKTPGTGLGLGLVKRLVEILGGVVWVESEGEGKGSTFGFNLPFDTDQGTGSERRDE